MAPTDGPSSAPQNQKRKKCCRPRTRRCLLKGCKKRFHPKKALERYCSDECRDAARKWSLWKAQLKYRATEHGKDQRKEQSRRNRKRVKHKKNHEFEAKDEAARVITINFFLPLLRPSWMLRDVQIQSEITAATILLKGMPESYGTGLGTRTAMEKRPNSKKPFIRKPQCLPFIRNLTSPAR